MEHAKSPTSIDREQQRSADADNSQGNTNTHRSSVCKNSVKVDQFYPSLENQKQEGNTVVKLNTEQSRELVPVIVPSGTEKEQPSDQPDVDNSETSEHNAETIAEQESFNSRRSESVSPSFVSTSQEEFKVEDGSEEVFSTQVEEDTLEAAKLRREKAGLHSPDGYANLQSPLLSQHQVVENKVKEHFQAGLEYFEAGRYDNAIHCFSKAITLKTHDAILFMNRAECYLQLCDFQSAILNYKRVCFLEPDNLSSFSRLASIYLLQGQCMFDQKQYQLALEAFVKATELKPQEQSYQARIWSCLGALGRHADCLVLVNKHIEKNDDNPDLFIVRARLHQVLQKPTLHYQDVKRALDLDPENPEAQKLMGTIQQRAVDLKQKAIQLNLKHRYKSALEHINLAINVDQSQVDFYIIRGALQRRLGDYNAAIDDYLSAMHKMGHDENASMHTEAQKQLILSYNDFAVDCFTKGFYEEAIALLNKAIDGEKKEKGLYINRGDCFFKQGDLEFALADYEQALEMDELDGAVKGRIAAIHYEYGLEDYHDKQYPGAETRLTRAIKLNPAEPQYYITRCKVRQLLDAQKEKQEGSGACLDLMAAMQLDPSHADVPGLTARVFPGRSIRDVVTSDAARRLQQSFGNLSLHGAVSGTSTHQTPSDRWKPSSTLPSLKACLEDKDFNIKLAAEKKQIKAKIRNQLQTRSSLSYQNQREIFLPSAHQQSSVKQASASWNTFHCIPDKV